MAMLRKMLPLAVVLTLVVATGATVSAGVRHPVGVKGLWWGEIAGVAVDARGDVYVTGSEGRQHEHMIVRRYARGGGLLWERTFRQPGEDRWTRGRDVAVGPDGTVYVAGILTTPHHHAGPHEIATFLRAYGPAGALRWQRVVTIEGFWDPAPNAVAAGPGFVVMAGHTSCFECVSHEGWLRAWNPKGRLLWVDDFEFRGIDVAKRDMPNDVAVDTDGSVFVVGVVDRLEDGYGGIAPSDSEVVVRRMTRSGATVWTKILTDRSKDSDEATSVSVADGGLLVGALFGSLDARSRPAHPWLRLWTTGGDAVWTRVWTGSGVWYALDATMDRIGRPFVAWSPARTSGRTTVVKALTPRGWLRWTSSVDLREPPHLAAGARMLHLAAGSRHCCHAKLYTYRA